MNSLNSIPELIFFIFFVCNRKYTFCTGVVGSDSLFAPRNKFHIRFESLTQIHCATDNR